MPEPLAAALADLRTLLTDPDQLVRAVASGRRRNEQPRSQRVELRPVTLAAGPRLSISEHDGQRPSTRNVPWGSAADEAVADLLAEPFGNWHVAGTEQTVQLRVTKRGDAQVHRSEGTGERPDAGHDRAKSYLLAPDDPLFATIGGNAAKRRQVDAFLRALDATLTGDLPEPLRVVDLGCGNAYLTFAAYRYLTARRGLDVRLTGVDVRTDQRDRNTALAERLGWGDAVRFVAGTIADAPVDGADVVLALHACDTATDDAIDRAVRWRAPYLLAAPCCQHDVAAQLRRVDPPDSQQPLVRQPILRERFADVLTDGLRAELLRAVGYHVDVVEFVDSAHTPRNLLLRAHRDGAVDRAAALASYRSTVDSWRITPALATLLSDLL
ncbi:MAG: SAM-dependent methyltransferase [Actinocatenispora sp.]